MICDKLRSVILRSFFIDNFIKMDSTIEARLIKPGNDLPNYVNSFWMLNNQSETPKEIIVLPDGKIDLMFS